VPSRPPAPRCPHLRELDVEDVRHALEGERVESLADIVAPSLAGPCVDGRFTAVGERDGRTVGLVDDDGEVSEEPIPSTKPRRPEPLARALSPPTTRALPAVGIVRDLHRIAAVLLARMAVGEDADSVVCLGEDAHLRFPDGRLERAELDTPASSGGSARPARAQPSRSSRRSRNSV
jgi:hypothetical protein